jgi:hypothetical protein
MNIVRVANINYTIDANRRRFDNWNAVKDTRIHNISNRTVEYIDINKVDESLLLEKQISS